MRAVCMATRWVLEHNGTETQKRGQARKKKTSNHKTLHLLRTSRPHRLHPNPRPAIITYTVLGSFTLNHLSRLHRISITYSTALTDEVVC